MPKIKYVEENGKEHEVEVPAGWSVMEGAVQNLFPGIDADCGSPWRIGRNARVVATRTSHASIAEGGGQCPALLHWPAITLSAIFLRQDRFSITVFSALLEEIEDNIVHSNR